MEEFDYFGAEQERKSQVGTFFLGIAVGVAGLSALYWMFLRDKVPVSSVGQRVVRYIPGPEGRVKAKTVTPLPRPRPRARQLMEFEDIPTWRDEMAFEDLPTWQSA